MWVLENTRANSMRLNFKWRAHYFPMHKHKWVCVCVCLPMIVCVCGIVRSGCFCMLMEKVARPPLFSDFGCRLHYKFGPFPIDITINYTAHCCTTAFHWDNECAPLWIPLSCPPGLCNMSNLHGKWEQAQLDGEHHKKKILRLIDSAEAWRRRCTGGVVEGGWRGRAVVAGIELKTLGNFYWISLLQKLLRSLTTRLHSAASC